MAFAQINGFKMYCEEHGPSKDEAETFLLIMGFGGNATAWASVVPVLAERYHVVAFDNRGAGRSELPDLPAYTMPMMADDAIGLLTHLGIERAHVWGVSMGGMIAQEVVLRHPERVITLTLGCTTPGGAGNVQTDPADSAEFFRLGTLPPEEAIVAGLPMLYSQSFVDANRQRLIEQGLANADLRASEACRKRQFAGIMAHDTTARLGQIKTPTLVVTGTGDRVVNAANSKRLADGIPGAELIEYPGVGHGYFIEVGEQTTREVMDFAARHSPIPA
jgi:pimeloyl-ACP methyl ester carboxylesterase